MDRTLKTFSILLTYPSEELVSATGELREAVTADRRLNAAAVRAISGLLDELEHSDIWQLRERFVELFDRSRTLSLNLFEHVHGENRSRGSAMVSLLETYEAAGFVTSTSELPDHLPTLLEYLSLRPAGEAREILADAAHILEALQTRLERRGSRYAAVFQALVRISGPAKNREALAELIQAPEMAADNLAALDKAWEDSEVTFGTGSGQGCGQARDMLARMRAPESDLPGSESVNRGSR